MAAKEMFLAQQPDFFKPLQSILAVLILISLGSATAVHGTGVLWFIGLTSLIISTLATILFMVHREGGLSGLSLGGGFVPWSVIEFVYSSILTLLCGVGFWLSFGYAGHVEMDDHSAGYIFAGIFLIAQMVCYCIPVLIIYERHRNAAEHEPIVDVIHPFGVSTIAAGNGEEQQRYQTIQSEQPRGGGFV